MNSTKKVTVYTIGHSTRNLEDFISLLRENNINEVVDIRTIPKSRHNPQFNEETLAQELRNKHIGYRHMKDLGGLRHAKKDSVNIGWRNVSFRGYADYMQTEEFRQALSKLIELAHEKQVVIMCAEAVPWRCHRSLIGDALLIRNIKALDIFSHDQVKEHTLTPWAKVNGHEITYPEQ